MANLIAYYTSLLENTIIGRKLDKSNDYKITSIVLVLLIIHKLFTSLPDVFFSRFYEAPMCTFSL